MTVHLHISMEFPLQLQHKTVPMCLCLYDNISIAFTVLYIFLIFTLLPVFLSLSLSKIDTDILIHTPIYFPKGPLGNATVFI